MAHRRKRICRGKRMKTYQIHPLAKFFPSIEGEEFDGMVKDIKEHGCREPITLYEGKVLDGANRYRACRAAGVEPQYWTFQNGDPKAFVVSANLLRRHLSLVQRAAIIADLTTPKAGRPETPSGGGVSASDLREKLQVSEETLRRTRHVKDKGIPALFSMMKEGKVAIANAAHVADLPRKQQENLVGAGAGVVTAAGQKRATLKRDAAKTDHKAEAKKDSTAQWTKAIKDLHVLVSLLPESDTLAEIRKQMRPSLAKQLIGCKDQLIALSRKVSQWI